MDAYLSQCFLLIVLISGIPLAACSITGLITSVLQASTQISEQSIAFLVKFLTLSAVLALFYPYIFHRLLSFFQQVLFSIALMGRVP